MKAFMKNGDVLDIAEYEYQEYQDARTLPPKKKDEAKINIGGKNYRLNDFRFIGEWCHNKGGSIDCQAYSKWNVKAHSIGEVCPYEFTGDCEKCGKRMWERDREYSQHMFGKIVCAKHVPDYDLRGRFTKVLKKP